MKERELGRRMCILPTATHPYQLFMVNDQVKGRGQDSMNLANYMEKTNSRNSRCCLGDDYQWGKFPRKQEA